MRGPPLLCSSSVDAIVACRNNLISLFVHLLFLLWYLATLSSVTFCFLCPICFTMDNHAIHGTIAQPTQQTIQFCCSCCGLMSSRVMAERELQGNDHVSLGAVVQRTQPNHLIRTCDLCQKLFTSRAFGDHQGTRQEEREVMRRQQGRTLITSPRGQSPCLEPQGHLHAHTRERETLIREETENLNLLSRKAIPSPGLPPISLDLSLATGTGDRTAKGPSRVKVQEWVLALEAVPRNNVRDNSSSAKLKRTRQEFEGLRCPKVNSEELDLTLKL